MITVTGKIENASGESLHARIDFVSRSTPLVVAGVITTNTDKSIRSNPADGTFAVQLAPGNYTVNISAENQSTSFNIAVPDGSGSASIETLVTTPLLYPFIAPNTVWNRVLTGNIIVSPIDNPAAPATSPVIYAGGHQDNTSSFNYKIAWQVDDGTTTAASPDMPNVPPTGANNATRLTIPQPPSGITSILIYRSNDASSLRFLLASVSPNSAHYDDWESQSDFAARLDPAQLAPAINTTAGGFLTPAGQPIAWLASQGLNLPGGNARFKNGKGWQFYNFDTALWHTLACQGNPPQLGLDAGEA